jgi:uncharacterized protein (DUF302 family)
MKNGSTFSSFLVFIIAILIGVGGTLYYLRVNLGSLLVYEVQSPLGFEETLAHIEAKAKSIGWKVPKKWKANFQRNFNKIAKKDIGPMKLLKMCEPHIAADLLMPDKNKYLSVMMPCTFSVYEKSDGKTYVAMMNLQKFATAMGGDVVPAMEKAWPDMLKMIDFSDAKPAATSPENNS